jgi:hypothetical protein
VASAGDQITASPSVPGLYPVILLGDASASLLARDGATLGAVANPTLLSQGLAQNAALGNNYSYFSTYGPDSALTLRTLAGVAELSNDTTPSGMVASQYTTVACDTRGNGVTPPNPYYELAIYPGTLALESLRGSVTVDNSLTSFPSSNGSISLLAHDNVNLGASQAGSFQLLESDSDPALLPSVASPQGDLFTVTSQLAGLGIVAGAQNAAIPVHLSGAAPDSTLSRVVALTGDVSLDNNNNGSELYFAAPARVVAGQDVLNLAVDFQNLESTDVSAVIAGRDITYAQPRAPAGQIEPVLSSILVDGPGTLEIAAGRNLNLGSSEGILSRGNLANPNLQATGADISLEAGIGTPSSQNFATFISDYLAGSSAYTSDLIAYMQPFLRGSPNAAQALSAFNALPPAEQEPLILEIFFDELRASGRAAAAPGPLNANFTRGFDAITALFPGGNPDKNQTNPYAGDISLFFSQIYTLDGGNINLLAPGGLINAGLATPPASFGINKPPSQLGVVAQGTGSVNAYTYGDFEVNQSRVFAADGGDILIWSSQGNIDAGRGAKTAISAPPPTITYVNGVPTVTFPAALTGSGIQTLATSTGVLPGDVDLFAPHGVVNANDAGIVAGNLTIAATAVLGANNIKVSGVSVGVPVETSGLGASLAGVSAVGSSASQAATQGFADNAARTSTTSAADTAMGWLDVFIEGFGEEVCKPNDAECLKRQKH